MIELATIDDVGRAQDRCVDNGVYRPGRMVRAMFVFGLRRAGAAARKTPRNPGRFSVVALAVLVSVFAVSRARSSSAFVVGGLVGSRVHVREVHSYGVGSASRDVDVESVVVRFAPGSARAATEVSICRQAVASQQLGHAISEVEMNRYCDPQVPAIGGRLHRGGFGLGAEYLVLTVVPLEPGMVLLTDVAVHYRSGGHTRADSTGPRFELTVEGN